MFKKILVASDGSENAYHASLKAVELAKGLEGSYIEFVFVVRTKNSKNNGTHVKQASMSQATDKAKKENIDYKIKVLSGEPAEEITNYANNNHFDLVVMGQRGLNPIQEFVLGSVSKEVLKRVSCPVLIVK